MTTIGTNEPFAGDIVSAVRAAASAAPARKLSAGFSLTLATAGQRVIAPIIGLYLGYAVVRLPEVFPQLAVPHLPMILMLIFIATLSLTVPAAGWVLLWRSSRPLRAVTALLGVVVVTIPIGIWPRGSFDFLTQHYMTDVVIFLACLIVLRDRRTLRTAMTIYVLATAAVAFNVLRTYDPNELQYTEDGDLIDPHAVALRPELRRLRKVGESLDPNDFGAILATTFPVALWLSVGSLRRRVFWTGIAGLLVVAVVPTQSRGSELGFVAAAAVILALGSRGWRRWLSGALLVAGGAVFVIMATGIGANGRFADFSSGDYNVSGSDGRFYFWKQGMIWMLKRPWGYGIENFSTYFGILNGQDRAAHSSWVQYGMELGVAGLVLIVGLFRYLVNGLRALRKRAASLIGRDPAARDEDSLAGHMLAMLAGLLVTGTFLSNAYYPIMYMGLGLAAATLLGSPLPEDVTPTGEAPPPPRASSPRRIQRFPNQPPAR